MAYRSRSRPSSTLGAKASTVCPYYLDGDLAQRDLTSLAERFDLVGPGDTRLFSRRLSMAADVASVQFSRTVERLYAGLRWACAEAIFYIATAPDAGRAPVSQSSTACWRV